MPESALVNKPMILKIKRITILSFLILLVVSSSLRSQTMSLENKTAQIFHQVNFPITASGFPTNIGAITLYIGIDTCVLHYDGFTTGSIPGVGVNIVGQSVVIAWFNVSGGNINGTLLTLKFSYKGENCNLTFLPGADIETITFEIVTTTFVNGSVSSSGVLPVIYYVDGSVGSSGNGLSWGTALKTIHEATNKTLYSADNVLVKPGTYNDTVVVRSSGLEILHINRGVSVSDTNRITFPSNISLCSIRITEYPGKYFAYVFRSWKGNNGVYEITGVNDALHYITVTGAEFKQESGTINDTSSIQVSVGVPVIYKKYSSNPESERVIINGLAGTKAICYIGKPTSTDWITAIPANYNIIDGFDVTGITGMNGVQISSSKFNVYRNGRVYELDTAGIFITGDSIRPANYNIIEDNKIYNTLGRACAIGRKNISLLLNQANFNHIIRNEIYSTTGTKINYRSAITVNQFNKYEVIEGNVLRDFKLRANNNGAIEIWNTAEDVLVYGNYLKNVSQTTNTWTNALVYVHKINRDLYVFNNVMADSVALADSLYAFRLDASKHINANVAYNTVYNIRRGILFEDDGTSPAPNFKVTDNIFYIFGKYFTHTGTTGRFTVSYNCYRTNPTAPGQPYHGETGRQVGDPLFINTSFFASPNGLRLKTGSMCLNNGLSVSPVSEDYAGLPRSANSPSIGAFELPLTSCSWLGAVSTSWFDYRNWDCKLVPLSGMNVTIPDRANDPVISSGNAVCKTLTVKTGAQVHIIPPGIITISNP
jgi:hypothetical protein